MRNVYLVRGHYPGWCGNYYDIRAVFSKEGDALAAKSGLDHRTMPTKDWPRTHFVVEKHAVKGECPCCGEFHGVVYIVIDGHYTGYEVFGVYADRDSAEARRAECYQSSELGVARFDVDGQELIDGELEKV